MGRYVGRFGGEEKDELRRCLRQVQSGDRWHRAGERIPQHRSAIQRRRRLHEEVRIPPQEIARLTALATLPLRAEQTTDDGACDHGLRIEAECLLSDSWGPCCGDGNAIACPTAGAVQPLRCSLMP